jgi:hypothetical protein
MISRRKAITVIGSTFAAVASAFGGQIATMSPTKKEEVCEVKPPKDDQNFVVDFANQHQFREGDKCFRMDYLHQKFWMNLEGFTEFTVEFKGRKLVFTGEDLFNALLAGGDDK